MFEFDPNLDALGAFLGDREASEEDTSFEAMVRKACVSNPEPRVRVASLEDLEGFVRIASNQLVRKAERDLWALEEDAEGNMSIVRLFDEDGDPLKV